MNRVRLLAIIEAETITGPAKNLLQFAKIVRLAGTESPVDPAIVTFVRAGRDSGLFVNKAREASLPVYTIAENGRFDRSVIGSLKRIVAEFRPGIIQTHAVKSHFLLRASGCHRSAPWVAFHHGYTWPDLRARMYNELDRWSLRAADRVVTVSQPFRDQITARGVHPDRIDVVHNAVDPDWGSRYRSTAGSLRRQLNIAEEDAVLLIVGRLSREKDHLTLLRAVGRASGKAGRRIHLLIVGDGPERPRIESEIQALGLNAQVTLVGQQPSAEPYYAAADIAVLSSLSEGSPNALLEAMAAGVPAVATCVGGIPEIASDGKTAILVSPGDTAGMADGILRFVNHPEVARSMAAEARRFVLSHYTPEVRVRRLYDIYERILENNSLMGVHRAADGNVKGGNG